MTDLDSGADLHALMDRALTDLPTPTARLHAGALREGRPMRRRRRAGAALGGVALAVAAVAITLPVVNGSDDSAPGGVATDPGSPQPTFAEPPAGWWDMPGRVMERRLDALLPADLTITDADHGNEERAPGEKPHGGWLAVDVADAEGDAAGGLNVVLYAPVEDDGAFVRERTTCPGNLDGPATPCSEMYDEAGDPIGRTTRWVAGDVVVLEFTQLLPDGGLVYASASNSSDDKWGEEASVDTDRPPVDIVGLKVIALSSTWQDWTPKR